MGDAAYWDNWAGAIGPAPPTSLLSLRGEGLEVRAGSSVAARIVDCTPRRTVAARGRAGHPCQDFAASVPRPGGSLPPPGPPLASLCCARGMDRLRSRSVN